MKIIKGSPRSEVYRTIRQLMEMVDDGEINDNIDIQRGYVWKSNDKRSRLIRTLIIDRSVPTLYFNKVEDIWELIDGKQRLNTIHKFINNEFQLSGLENIQVINDDGELEEIDINGMTFDNLPEYFQNAIKDYNIQIALTDNASQEEVADTFYNLNNGQAMNAATMNRIKAKSKEQIIRLGKHEIFKYALSETALNGHVDEELAVKTHAMLYSENPSMDNKYMRPYMKDVIITKEQETEIMNVLTRIKQLHDTVAEQDKKTAKKIYVRTHMISMTPIIKKSLDDNVNIVDLKEWALSFYCGSSKATVSFIYNMAAGAGSGKPQQVAKRVEEVEKSYDNFMNKHHIYHNDKGEIV